MPIGGSISAPLLGSPAETILNREFQSITPANAFKQTSIHPEPGVWNWRKADAWVDRCEQRGEIMRLHACVSPQCSAWAEEDHRTPEELRQVMEEYVEGVCKRYGNRKHVSWIDVVNETVTRQGEWFGPKKVLGSGRIPGLKLDSMKATRFGHRCTLNGLSKLQTSMLPTSSCCSTNMAVWSRRPGRKSAQQ